MKRTVTVTGIYRRDIGEILYSRIVSICPEGDMRGVAFHFKFGDADGRLEEIVQVLEDHDIRPLKLGEHINPNRYLYEVDHVYEDTDLDQAEYFRCSPDPLVKISRANRDPKGPLEMRFARRPKTIVDFANTELLRYRAVSTPFREALEQANLIGTRFDPVTPRLRRKPAPASGEGFREATWDEIGDPVWGLTGDIELPPVSACMRFINFKGQPCNGDFSKGVRFENDFDDGTLHYLRKDIERVEPFDVAVTAEPIGGPRAYSNDPAWLNNDRWPIVSRRFYELCKEWPVKIRWWPVFVDDE